MKLKAERIIAWPEDLYTAKYGKWDSVRVTVRTPRVGARVKPWFSDVAIYMKPDEVKLRLRIQEFADKLPKKLVPELYALLEEKGQARYYEGVADANEDESI